MSVKHKRILSALLLPGVILLIYAGWLATRPVEIIAVHHRESNFSAVLLKNPPLTDKGKISWWLENKAMLKARYNIPNPGKDGFFYVTFWSFGEGYKEEGKYDRLCFEDMPTKINCIEKDPIFSVDKSRNWGTTFTVYDGDDYHLEGNGKFVKIPAK